MKRVMALTLIGVVCVLPAFAGPGGNVVYMDSGPADAHVQDWVNLLTNDGYTVTQVYDYPDITGADAGRLGELTSADLIIMGRHTNSGNYDDSPAEIDAWNAVTTPIVAMGPHNIRSNRLNWMSGTGLTAGQVTAAAVDPLHPIFTGVTLDANNQFAISTEAGTDYSTVDAGNATVIANVVEGTTVTSFPYIAYWDGTQPYYTGGPTPAGKRMIFFGGGGITDGDFDLTPDGQKAFLNTLEFTLTGTVSTGGGDCLTAGPDLAWMNQSFAPQTGVFTAEWDMTPSIAPLDGLVGLSNGSVAAYGDISVIVRFNPAGSIMDARNGGAYAADVALTYTAGTTYHIRCEVDTTTQTYDVFVTPQGQAEVQLANDYAFRIAATELNNVIGRMNSAGSTTMCNLTFPGSGGEGEGEGEPQGNTIVSNVYPPFIDVGTLVILTAPDGSGYVWKKDGAVITGETERSLVFNPAIATDAGSYTVEYVDTLAANQTTPAFNLTIAPEGTVPAASLAGLMLLAGACGLGGSRLIRRRK